MRLVKDACRILPAQHYDDMLANVCQAVSLCYKAAIPTTRDEQESFIRKRMHSKHMTIIEHVGFTALFAVNRGITHEMVRHRLSSYTQESTRYCNYANEKFDGHVTFIMPPPVSNLIPEGEYHVNWQSDLNGDVWLYPVIAEAGNEAGFKISNPWLRLWLRSMAQSEENYLEATNTRPGVASLMQAQEARDMLTHAVKADIVWTANMREWRHILNLRAIGTTGAPHPYMQQIMLKMLDTAKAQFPVFFEDL